MGGLKFFALVEEDNRLLITGGMGGLLHWPNLYSSLSQQEKFLPVDSQSLIQTKSASGFRTQPNFMKNNKKLLCCKTLKKGLSIGVVSSVENLCILFWQEKPFFVNIGCFHNILDQALTPPTKFLFPLPKVHPPLLNNKFDGITQ